MRQLLLTFSSHNTFTVTDESTGQVLGMLTYEISEASQPKQFVFTPEGGAAGHAKTMIAESLKDHFGDDIHVRISPIV